MIMVRVVHHADDRHFEKAMNTTLDELAKTAEIERISYDTTVVVNAEEGERHYFTAFIEYTLLSQEKVVKWDSATPSTLPSLQHSFRGSGPRYLSLIRVRNLRARTFMHTEPLIICQICIVIGD